MSVGGCSHTAGEKDERHPVADPGSGGQPQGPGGQTLSSQRPSGGRPQDRRPFWPPATRGKQSESLETKPQGDTIEQIVKGRVFLNIGIKQ
jgi:hypothetical protein